MENRRNNNGKRPTAPKKLPKERVFGANAVHLSEDSSSSLVGGIVEKGVSSDNFTTPSSSSSFPLPSPLPFPVARHRSHGPHWAPAHQFVAAGGGIGDDGNYDEEKDITNYEPLADFAKPVQTKKKKGLDFSRWKEVLRRDIVSDTQEKDNIKTTSAVEEQKMHEFDLNTDKNSLADGLLMDIDKNNSSPSDIHEPQLKSLYNDVDMSCEEFSSTDMVSVGGENPSPTFGSSSAGYEQGHMGLESQIDAENRALLGRMSTEEIAEAQAEIRNRFNPELLNLLKKRSINKLEKKKASSGLSPSGVNVLGDKQADRIKGEDESSVQESVSLPAPQTMQLLPKKPDEEVVQKSQSKGSSEWSSWSKRVEGVRNFRFSLDGNVIEGNSLGSTYTADNVAERDFLRTEGDPAAAGYTIKEALALVRSVIPGQRALALHLLASVLNKALHNICRSQVDCMTKFSDEMNVVDWEAIWAYALGPEPELALSLRLAIDDNHKSVTLASAKVIQCILACDLNEDFFNNTMKLARMDLFTAPVFRSRPDVKHGYFGGGFWKYSTKQSKILLPDEDVMNDKNEGERTIQDDNVVAGQDVAAGLVRMEILPRLLYLLETEPTAALEECILSILVAVVRHSPTSANAVWNCERLVQTIVHRFNMKDTLELQGAKIKSVTLLRVLAQSSKTICIDIINKGFFQVVTWSLYVTPSMEEWIKSGSDRCKLASQLMVELLRFWKVCIMYGLCISFFTGFFPALCLWLNPPTFDMLTKINVFNDFAAVTTEVYLVLGALADVLPDPYSSNIRNQQNLNSCGDNVETWCWIDVFPMVDSALQWLELSADTTLLKFFDHIIGVHSKSVDRNANASSLLWILSAAMNFLHIVLVKATPRDVLEVKGSSTNEKVMPEFAGKLALKIIKNGIFNFSDQNEDGCSADLSGLSSVVDKLCYFTHKSDPEASLASVWCLNALVRMVVSTDRLIHQTREKAGNKLFEVCELGGGCKILPDGILKSSRPQWGKVLTEFMNIVTSKWHGTRPIEVFGRGGPAPGVGVGWGAFGGGFWSAAVVAIQADATLLIELLGPWLSSCSMDPSDKEEKLMMQIINSVLASSLMMGPGDKMILQKIFDILLKLPVLKYLDQCILSFLLCYNGKEPLKWEYKEDELMIFCKILASHFTSRWLDVKKKKNKAEDDNHFKSKTVGGGNSLATIPEDPDTSDVVMREVSNSLMVEWARQQMPLPSYWLLSPIATISIISSKDMPNSSTAEPDVQGSVEVAKAGLFLLLGIEAMSSRLSAEDNSAVRSIPLIWRLHSLSVPLLVGMGVIEEEKSRDVYRALQSLYGQCLDELRSSITKVDVCETSVKADLSGDNCLKFQAKIHENYSTFIEALVEQFAAVSYGDVIYGRQISVYLHRQVETSVRLATWNALSNARVLELLPPLDNCISRAEGYLEPVEDNDGILEAYVKSWVSGALDRSATRGSAPYMIAVHHLSSFIFSSFGGERSTLRNKLVKSLLRDFARKRQHEAMMLDLIQCNHSSMTLKSEQTASTSLQADCIHSRLAVLKEACEGNSQLLTEVDRLESSIKSKHSGL